ncbi:MAG TPA: JDVT-CTERM domain-containing protein [Polyangia bacterium]|nr:JDVT-CTERM domain-containing protein [Polyangia bacterium]
MNGRAMTIRWSILAALGCVLAANRAEAMACVNDVDCPEPACGGQVCDYIADPTQTCKPAGTQPKGSDGWCSKDSDCKCASLGATCVGGAICSFTKPSDAPSGGGGHSGTAGSTGAAGSSATGTGGAPATGTGGSAAAGHTGSTDGGSSGGCSVAGSSAPATWFALSVLGGLVVAVRRRRRAR